MKRHGLEVTRIKCVAQEAWSGDGAQVAADGLAPHAGRLLDEAPLPAKAPQSHQPLLFLAPVRGRA